MDSIVLNDKTYTGDMLGELAETLKLEKIFTTYGGILTFFQKSLLSNFYQSPFEVNMHQFQSMEQHLAIQKVQLFGDHKAVSDK